MDTEARATVEPRVLTDDELFIARKAVEKLVKPYVKDAEGELKADMQRRYEQDGTDRRALRFGGVEVGHVTARRGKAGVKAVLGREGDLLAYLQGIGLVEVKPARGWETRFACKDGVVADNETGEVCDFLEPAAPTLTWAVTGCEPEEVLPLLPSGRQIIGMLEG